MRINSIARALALGCLTAFSVQAQDAFAATAKTVTVDTGDPNTSPTANRLFMDAAFAVPAPIGTAIWFVADPSGNGLPASAVPGTSGDDVVLHKDVVDGSLPFNKVGQFQRVGILVPNLYAQAVIHVVVWNGQGADFAPTQGSQYGVIRLGVRPPPTTGSGNASWSITENVSATQFTVGGAVEPNRPPLLAAVDPLNAAELTPVSFTASATDPDIGQILTYTLAPGAPLGASIHPSTGVFTWTPVEADGPGTFPVTVRVTDNGLPPLFAERTVLLTVSEANVAPVLAAIPAGTGKVGTLLTFTLSASDVDLPKQDLRYELLTPLDGASLDPVTGVFTWTPTAAQVGTKEIRLAVRDSASPSSESQQVTSFVIAPRDAAAAPVLSIRLEGELVLVTFSTQIGRSYSVEVQETLGAANWAPLGPVVSGMGSPVDVLIPIAAGATFVRVTAR
jgi:hypothetical protein